MSWAGIVIAVVGAGAAVHQGEQTRKAANKQSRAAKAAQRQSLLASVNQDRIAQQQENRLNRRRPDAMSILFNERSAGSTGPASTILSGRSAKGNRPLLGSKSLLGG